MGENHVLMAYLVEKHFFTDRHVTFAVSESFRISMENGVT